MKAKILATVPLLFAALPASAQTGPGYSVVHGWPTMPEGRVLGPAAGVGVNSAKGEVYVFHRVARAGGREPIKQPTVAVFDAATGKLLREWGEGVFLNPHGLSIAPNGNVWLTDTKLNQVFEYTPDGKQLRVLGEKGVAGKDAAHFDQPTDVAVMPDGSFYVSDGYGNTRVIKFAADGKFLMQWGEPGTGPGQFNTPHAVVPDGKGKVYVADRYNDRVQVFDEAGKFLAQWKSAQLGRPFGLALLPGNRLAVVDGGEQPPTGPDHDGVSVVDTSGKVIERFSRIGLQDGQLWVAHDIAADTKGTLYVVDVFGQRVQKFVPKR